MSFNFVQCSNQKSQHDEKPMNATLTWSHENEGNTIWIIAMLVNKFPKVSTKNKANVWYIKYRFGYYLCLEEQKYVFHKVTKSALSHTYIPRGLFNEDKAEMMYHTDMCNAILQIAFLTAA